MNPLDKHKFAEQPQYHTCSAKIKARQQVLHAYRTITGLQSIPNEKGYWTLCNKQPDTDGAEIVQLVKSGLITKSQFFGIDYDLKDEGVIDFNRQCHPEANWFQGDWLDVIEEHYEMFNPALVHFDYTKTIITTGCHIYLAKTMNLCPPKTVLAANLMLSDGHSSRRFDASILVESIRKHLRDPQDWVASTQYYSYKASRTEMGTFIFTRK